VKFTIFYELKNANDFKNKIRFRQKIKATMEIFDANVLVQLVIEKTAL